MTRKDIEHQIKIDLTKAVKQVIDTGYPPFPKLGDDSGEVETTTEVETDEWVWVDAFKGTNKNMMCRDMQYELGTTYEFDGEVEICLKGYHCCPELEYVFNYYKIGNGNRFFKVRALVKRNDLDDCNGIRTWFAYPSDKLVAKKIEFVSEITSEELFQIYDCSDRVKGEKYYETAREFGLDAAYRKYLLDTMVEKGYPTEVAEWLGDNCTVYQTELAIKIADAPHMSLATKYTIIFSRD